MESSKAIREMGHLVNENGKNIDHWQALKLEELLSGVPSNDRGYVLLAIIGGMGEGQGARDLRQMVSDYFNR